MCNLSKIIFQMVLICDVWKKIDLMFKYIKTLFIREINDFQSTIQRHYPLETNYSNFVQISQRLFWCVYTLQQRLSFSPIYEIYKTSINY